jgi:spoIIIJ-associated protein
MEIYEVEGKTKEEAIDKILEKTNSNEMDLYLSFGETEAKFLKAKKVVVKAVKKYDAIKFVKEYINKLGTLMNLDIKSEVNEKEEVINAILVSDNTPILIGKDGRTLNSLQMLIRQALTNKTGVNIKLNMDVSNYKAKKLKNLEYDIKKIVKEVLDTHEAVTLDHMNSYERRFVHNLVSTYPELSSISTGEGAERKITINYKD